jgi:UDP-N-acetylmuramoyl-tripeptide--D-alanyl-D-alanine ligase
MQNQKMEFTAGWVAHILGLPQPLITHSGFTSLVTDSRKVTPGCLFVALSGEKMDGHAFIDTAVAQGATGILCLSGTRVPLASAHPFLTFAVQDTRAAYRALAAAWRREFAGPVVMVAGSVGKTTTKELIAAILHGKWPQVLKTEASQNGFDGIPKTVLNLRSTHSAAVIEVGIDELGAMAQHMKIVAPSTSILTAIGPEHLETLGSIENVAFEEGLAFRLVSPEGTIVVNLDDPYIAPHTSIPGVRKICYTLKDETTSSVSSSDLANTILGDLAADGRSLQVSGLGLKNGTFPLPVSGRHNARNLLGAIAVAVSLGLTGREILSGLSTFKGPTGRSEMIDLPGNLKVICDYYNASPPSMQAGFQLLHETHANRGVGKKWACLGDMLELGTDEKTFHTSLAPSLLSHPPDAILLYGPRMKFLQQELLTRGYRGLLKHFDQQTDLAHTLTSGVQSGDTILIKGSRSMKMEEVWKILQNYANSHQTK